MPRCPAKDYLDRCKAVELDQNGLTRREIAVALRRPERWVYRTLARYDEQIGLESLKDRSSRPHHSPNRTPVEIEQAICDMKLAHPAWGRRQICKQLRWRWRDDPEQQDWLTESRVRCVLERHPELVPPAPSAKRSSPRQIDYLECNLLWGGDIHQTRLSDGSTWETLHWLDLYSRYELGQVTTAHLTEDMVVQSFLTVAERHGLPRLLKTDKDKLFYEPASGLPSLLERVLTALGVVHVPIGGQPWWNGVVERYIRTCRQEVHLPEQGDGDQMNQAMESERLFYNHERCHSRCSDQPPATLYQPSPRRIPPNFALRQVPITLQPTVVTRKVQAGGRISLAGRSYHFSRRYAGQTVTVTVDRWLATAEAPDGWQRTWDLHPQAVALPASPLPPARPKPLTRKVNKRGCISLNRRLYYVGIAWGGQKLTLQPQGSTWLVSFPDRSTKTLPDPQLLPQPRRKVSLDRPQTAPSQRPEPTAFQTRRVTKRGQVAFHRRLYYVGMAHQGQTVYVVPTSEGLAVYNTDHAWITTCPWKTDDQPDKPLCPT